MTTPVDDHDNPEWTAEDFAKADGVEALSQAELDAFPRTKRVGRPKAAVTKQAVNLRLDADVLAKFKATGPGWQTKINDALREAAPKAGYTLDTL
jgi:uncharacterized protein (DUF4415 family)